ncbi:MAG: HD-GYP domain-containing protein [Desulfovibrio sp.]
MVKELKISELEPGMYVVDTGLSWIDRPYVYSTEGRIFGPEDIRRIQSEGYLTAFVRESDERGRSGPNLARRMAGNGLAPLPAHQEAEARVRERLRKVPIKTEIQTAHQIHSQLVNFTRQVMRDVKLGKPVNYEGSWNLAGALVDSVMRNEDALLALKYLKSFDEYTYNHSINVAVVSTVFGKALGYSEELLRELCQAAVLHDLGKALVPDAILNKPGRLTNEEFDIMRGHPVAGYELLHGVRGPSEDVLHGALEHHEKYDGTGYPDGLAGEQISEFGRIIAVADVYDALTSERIYKRGMTPSNALRIMYGLRESDFHPGYVERFIRCLGIYPIGTLVRLTTGETGVVVQGAPLTPLLPTVRVILDAKRARTQPHDLDLTVLAEQLGMDAPRIEMAIENTEDDPLMPRIDPRDYLA